MLQQNKNPTILFVANINQYIDIGYAKKIIGQKTGFQKLGFECLLVTKASAPHRDCAESLTQSLGAMLLSTFSKKAAMLLEAYSIIKKNRSIEFVYLRYPRSDLQLFIFLLMINHRFNIKTIASEIPTFPYESEFQRSIKGFISKNVDHLFRHKCANLITKYVTIGYSGKIFNKETIKISNGVDDYPQHISPSLSNNLNIIGVGNISERHGYDRVLHGIRHYLDNSNNLPINFYIVGHGPSISKLRQLARALSIESCVFFIDPLFGESLDNLFNQCHVAIGNLAFHRIGVSETSALKEREYCARGIPFTMASSDATLDSVQLQIHRVPGNDEPIDIELLKTYAIQCQRSNAGEYLRSFAKQHLSWADQLINVFN